MFRTVLIFVLALSAASAQPGSKSRATAGKALPSDEPRHLRAWFKGGIGVEFTLQSTNPNSTITENNGITVNDAGITRIIRSSTGDMLFAYKIEAVAGKQPNTVTVRIKPASPEAVAAHTTVAAVREFPDLKMGLAVSLEILKNPATGETISDVLRPTTEPPPNPGFPGGADSEVVKQQLSFQDVSISINGKQTSPPPGWLTGAAARLYVPGHGAYYLTAYEPKSQPQFRAAGAVLQKTLKFAIDGEFFEIDSKGNLLTRSDRGSVWVYHDPDYKSPINPNASDVVMADAVEYLLAGK